MHIDKDRLYTDWEELRELLLTLQLFKQVCLEFEKANINGSLFNILPSMDSLLENLETAKEKYTEELHSSHFCTCINLAWEKLDKYYTLTELSPIYIAAVVLNPCLKWNYFESAWNSKPEWIRTAKQQFRNLWLLQYQAPWHMDDMIQVAEGSLGDSNSVLGTWTKRHITAQIRNHDEYDSYISTPPDPNIDDIRLWWLDRKSMWPRLSVMALEALAIPSMSADVERVFSR